MDRPFLFRAPHPMVNGTSPGTCRIEFTAVWSNGDKVNGEIKHLPPGAPTEMVKMLIASREDQGKSDG